MANNVKKKKKNQSKNPKISLLDSFPAWLVLGKAKKQSSDALYGLV